MDSTTMMDQNNGTHGIRMGGSLEELEAVYKIYGKLGSGGYGQVYRGVRRSDKFPVNGHCIPHEVSLHARVHHLQGIVAMLDHFKCPDGNHVLVMERPDPVMDLFDFITYNGALDETVARVFFRQLVRTVVRCHESGVVHRDIKDENVLINVKTGQLYLIDFGSSAMMQPVCYEKFDAGTRVYCPPEWVNHELFHPVYGTTWSLGVLLYDMLCGDIPFENEQQILAGHLSWERVGCSAIVSTVAKDLVRRLLMGAMEQRLTLEGVLAHPWMQSPLPPIFAAAMPPVERNDASGAIDTVDAATMLQQQQQQAVMSEANTFDYCFRAYAAKAIKKHQRKTGVKLLDNNAADYAAEGGIEQLQFQHQQQQHDTEVHFHQQQQQQIHHHLHGAGAASAPLIKLDQQQQQFQQQPHQQQAELAELIGDQQPPYSQPHFIIGEDEDEVDGSGNMLDDAVNNSFGGYYGADFVSAAPVAVPMITMPSASMSRIVDAAEPISMMQTNQQQAQAIITLKPALNSSTQQQQQQVDQERLLMQRINSIDSATSASNASVGSGSSYAASSGVFLPNITSTNSFTVPSTPTYYFGTGAGQMKIKQPSSGYDSSKDASVIMSPEISSNLASHRMPPLLMATLSMRCLSNATVSPIPPATLNLTRNTAAAGHSPANADFAFIAPAPLQQQRVLPAAARQQHLAPVQQIVWQQNQQLQNDQHRHSMMLLHANNSPHPYQQPQTHHSVPPPLVMRAFSASDADDYHNSSSSSSSSSSSPSSSAAGNSFNNHHDNTPHVGCGSSSGNGSVMSSPDTYYNLHALDQAVSGMSNCNTSSNTPVDKQRNNGAADSSLHHQLHQVTSSAGFAVPSSVSSSLSTITNSPTPTFLMPFDVSPVRQQQQLQQHAMTWPSCNNNSYQLARYNDTGSASEPSLTAKQQQQLMMNNNNLNTNNMQQVVFAYRQPVSYAMVVDGGAAADEMNQKQNNNMSLLPPHAAPSFKQQQFLNNNKTSDGFHSPSSLIMSANNNPASHHHQHHNQYHHQQQHRANNDDVAYLGQHQQQNHRPQQQFRSPVMQFQHQLQQQHQLASAMYLAAAQQQQQQHQHYLAQQQQQHHYDEPLPPYFDNELLMSSMQNQNLGGAVGGGVSVLPQHSQHALVQHIWSKVAPASTTTASSSSTNTTTTTLPSDSTMPLKPSVAMLANNMNSTSCAVKQQQQQQHIQHGMICKIDSGICLSSHLPASNQVPPVL